MATGTLTITLGDGTKLTGIGVNGSDFVSVNELSAATFAGKLSNVAITGSDDGGLGLLGVHDHMKLVGGVRHYTREEHGVDEGYYFMLRDVTAEEIEALRNRGDIDYIAMMTGVQL